MQSCMGAGCVSGQCLRMATGVAVAAAQVSEQYAIHIGICETKKAFTCCFCCCSQSENKTKNLFPICWGRRVRAYTDMMNLHRRNIRRTPARTPTHLQTINTMLGVKHTRTQVISIHRRKHTAGCVVYGRRRHLFPAIPGVVSSVPSAGAGTQCTHAFTLYYIRIYSCAE